MTASEENKPGHDAWTCNVSKVRLQELLKDSKKAKSRKVEYCILKCFQDLISVAQM
jgi:hypothetical protein